MIGQKQWMEEQLDAFRDTILKSNNEWCFIERLKIQEKVEAELSEIPADERYVKALEWMLNDLSTPFAEGEVFAGRMVEGPWIREDSPYHWISKPFFSNGHTTLDWSSMLSKGLLGMANDIAKNALEIGTEEAHRFAEYTKRCCQSIDKFAKRYAESARNEAELVDNPEYQRQLIRIADALENSPERPARNFFEALQAIWLVHLIVVFLGNQVKRGHKESVVSSYGKSSVTWLGISIINHKTESSSALFCQFRRRYGLVSDKLAA